MNAHRRKKMSKMAAAEQVVEKKEVEQLPLGLKKLEETVEEKLQNEVVQEVFQAVEEKVEQVVSDVVPDVDKTSSKKKKSFK
jgi:hypothetical protein